MEKTRRPSGILIAVEGNDGSGKSTQLHLLRRWLESQRYCVFWTEWNSSALVREATRRGKRRQELSPGTFSLIHAADFAARYEDLIVPHLEAGFVVLADRYVFTAYARDVVRGCPEEWVRDVYGFARRPDLTLYFQVPIDVAVSRVASPRRVPNYYEAGMDLALSPDPYESFRLFQGRLKDAYDGMATQEDFVIVDGTGTIETQQQALRGMVQELLRRIDPPRLARPLSVVHDLHPTNEPRTPHGAGAPGG